MKNSIKKLGTILSLAALSIAITTSPLAVSRFSESFRRVSNLETLKKAPSEVVDSARTQTARITLPKDRTVMITGPIDESTIAAADMIAKLGKTPEPIYVVLNSPGGSVFAGAAVIEAIEAAKGPVHTVCVQMCASMAAFIFEHGDQRLVFSRSMLMFHPASANAQGELDKMVSYLTAIQNFVRRMESYVAKRVGISLTFYKSLAAKELWLDSETAIAKKFADKVVFADLPEE